MLKFNSNQGEATINILIKDSGEDVVTIALKSKINDEPVTLNQLKSRYQIGEIKKESFEEEVEVERIVDKKKKMVKEMRTRIEETDRFEAIDVPPHINHPRQKARYFYFVVLMNIIIEENPDLESDIYIDEEAF